MSRNVTVKPIERRPAPRRAIRIQEPRTPVKEIGTKFSHPHCGKRVQFSEFLVLPWGPTTKRSIISVHHRSPIDRIGTNFPSLVLKVARALGISISADAR